jgi:transcriptional regulator with XRE-family HTH domain
MEFGRTISSLREKWGIEQKDLAKAIGVSKSYISIIENGRRKPSMRVLTKIAEYFELPISFFMYQASKSSGTAKSKKAKEALQIVDSIIQELAAYLMSDSKAATTRKRPSVKKPKQHKPRKKKTP